MYTDKFYWYHTIASVPIPCNSSKCNATRAQWPEFEQSQVESDTEQDMNAL
jgi:hypothetical protein